MVSDYRSAGFLGKNYRKKYGYKKGKICAVSHPHDQSCGSTGTPPCCGKKCAAPRNVPPAQRRTRATPSTQVPDNRAQGLGEPGG